MSDFGDFKEVTTKKEHLCVTCQRIIPKGKKALHYTGRCEGDWQNWYMCIPCDENGVNGWIDEYISGEEFSEWLMSQPEYECPKCKGIDPQKDNEYRWSRYIDWDWAIDNETVKLECSLCGHKWVKHIGFDSKKVNK